MIETRVGRSAGVLLLVLTLLCGVATAAWAGPGPEVSANVQVNDSQVPFPNNMPGRNTATLAASEDGKSLLAGWDDFQGFCGPPTNRPCTPPDPVGLSGYAFSTDGGLSWTDGGAPFPIGLAQTAGHPWVDRGGAEGDETFYFTSRMRVAHLGSAGIGIHRGSFGAGTFVWDDMQIINSPNPDDFYSRQAVAAAKDGSGAAYIALSNAIEICGVPGGGLGQIEVWRTHDSGDTWQGPVVVSPDTLTPDCSQGTLQVAPVPAVGPKGEVYVIWQYGPFAAPDGSIAPTSAIAFSRSLDGGVTFSAPQPLVTFNNMRDNPPVGYGKNRMNDQPRIAVATSGEHQGRIYVTYYQSVQPVQGLASAQSVVSSNIYILYSDDQGQTWSAPQEIVGPVPATGVKRFWPTVAVRPGGDVDVVYLESQERQITLDPVDIECNVPFGNLATTRRRGPVSSLVDTYWIQSRDGGVTFGEPVRVSEETSNWCTANYIFVSSLYSNYGDYLGIATGGNRTLTVWPDSRTGFVDVFFAQIKGKDK